MIDKKKFKLQIIPYPFLFAGYMVMGQFVQNQGVIPITQLFRPTILILAFTGLLYSFIFLLTHAKGQTAFLTTLFIFCFFAFGHFYRLVSYFTLIRQISHYELLLHVLWILIFAFFANPYLWKKIKNKTLLTNTLNIISMILLIYPVISIFIFTINFYTINRLITNISQPTENLSLRPNPSMPDIYYIILDGYGRQDVLDELYEYDNSDFIEFLKEKGFYVADQSYSNYMQTQLSLSSSLNSTYLDFLSLPLGNSENREPLDNLIENNAIKQLLEENGYQFVTISGFARFNDFENENNVFSPIKASMTGFESLLLSNSIFEFLLEKINPGLYLLDYNTQRKYVTFAFDMLPEVAKLPGPKFVYVHIWAPHPPFIFDETGNFIEPDRPFSPGDASGFAGTDQEYMDGYKAQINYVSNQMTLVLDSIFNNPARPPIILLQGDHGPGMYTDFSSVSNTCLHERFAILNAYYFPDQDYGLLYPEITPVNSFRVILNKFFDAKIGLVEDKSYYAIFASPYQFTDVTDLAPIPCELK